MTPPAPSSPPRTPRPPRTRPWWPPLAAALLLAIYAALAISSMARKGNAFDEMSHLTAGVSYLLTGDHRLNPEQGTLPQRWAALPVYLGPFQFPSLDQPWWRISNEWALGQQFFFELGNDVQSMLFRARLMIVLLGVALGLLVYGWSSRLFGPIGGLLSLAVYCLSPTILAHTQLVTSDAAAALAMTAAVGAFWLMLHRITLPTVALSCLATAALFLCKASSVTFIGMALLLAAIRLFAGGPLMCGPLRPTRPIASRESGALVLGLLGLTHVLALVLTIWAVFGFRYEAMRHPTADDQLFASWEDLLSTPPPAIRAVATMRQWHVLPEAYLWGLAYHSRTTHQSRAAFLNGEYAYDGWWSFFPYCLLVKTPLPTLALLALAASGAVILHARRPDLVGRRFATLGPALYRTAPLWVLLLVFWTAVLTARLNIGHRHLLPTYPAMFILAGAAVSWSRLIRRGSIPLLAAPLFLLAAESLVVWPDYLAYFNPLAGGPSNGYRHLVDSSLDWGQDLPALRRYLDAHHPKTESSPPVYLLYFGSGDPSYYGIDAQLLPGAWGPAAQPPANPSELTAGLYCISATELQAVYARNPGPWCRPYEAEYQYYRSLWQRSLATGAPSPSDLAPDQRQAALLIWQKLRATRLCAYLRQHRQRPDAQVGHSILLYNLTEQEIRDALDGPAPEPLPDAPRIKGMTRPSRP
ncbi:MAG: hypothetical protein IT442_01805 [Phycisphaeraceae bacterium]|nr:hypothetical protein [Phycisphaeraceae bacterium]